MFHILSDLPTVSVNMYQLMKKTTVKRPSACFLCMLKGQLTLLQDTLAPVTLCPEDILFLPPDTVCELTPESPAILLYVEFHPFFLLEALGFSYERMEYNSHDYPRNGRQKLVNDLASLAVSCLTERQDNDCQILSKSYHILHYVALNAALNNATPLIEASELSKTDRKLAEYTTYIEAHFQHALSLGDVAAQLGYTPQYLSNFLKKNLHMTFQEHLNKLRVAASLLLLRYSKEAVSRVAAMCGFTNTVSFETAFMRLHNCTPEEYRTSHQLSLAQLSSEDALVPIDNITLELDYIFNYMHYVSKHDLHHEDFLTQLEKVNTAKQTSITPSWNNIINLGTAADFEKPAFRYALRIMQERLHFQYGRCLGLFSLVTMHRSGDGTTYDFSKVFDMLDYMRSIHLKPLFEITNKPFHMYKVDENVLTDYAEFLDPETYDTQLLKFLPTFIKVCINRYGFDEFSTWKFELWRRYAPAMISLEEPRIYCERFQKFAGIIKSLVPDAVIGGPGFNTFLDSSYFLQLMKPFTEAAYRPDFISAYYFPYMSKVKEPSEVPSGYTTATRSDTMHEKILSLNEICRQLGFENTPLYITEFSSYLSSRNYINDSTYPAVFILQQVLENYGHVNALAYWLASDISLAYGNYSSPLFGGNGILTKDGIPKASFYALEFLNQLGHFLVARGEHYIVTSSGENSYQILVYYASALNEDFATSPFNQELLHYPYSAFEDVLPLDFQLDLTHLTTGNYLLKTQSITLNHGNVLNSWGQLEYLKTLRRSEVEYLRHESVPSTKIRFEQVNDHFYLQTKLNRNEATLFSLELYR